MSSNFFVNTYQLYKEQTDKLAQWLVDNAAACGYKLPEPDKQVARQNGALNGTSPSDSAPSPTPSGRLKGRARKDAKLRTAAASVVSVEDATSQPTYRIKLSQFTELARKIAESSGTIVPASVIKLAGRVVDLRRGFSRFYEKQATDSTRTANLKHAHFVSTLEEVISILKAPSSGASNDSVNASTSTNTGDTVKASTDRISSGTEMLSNQFDHLELEEPIDIDDTSPALNAATPTTGATASKADDKVSCRVEYQSDNDEDDEEKYFAMYCLFTDLHGLRTFIGKTWEDYSDGKMDLMAASVLTNTAFDLVRRTETKFFTALPEFESAQKLIQFFMLFISILRGVNPRHREQPDDWFNYEVADVAQWLYLPTFILLDGFCDVIQPRQMPLMKPGFFGIYDPKADRKAMSLRQMLAEDKIILLEALPEFCLLGDSKVQFPGEDELTKGLREMYKTKKISLFLCFATQIYLDITHIRRDRIGSSFHDLQAIGRQAKKTLNTALAQPHSILWPEENDKILRNTLEFIDYWITKDAIDKMRRVLLKSMYDKGITEPYYLFSRHPLLCGLLQFSLTMMMREAGSAMAMCWGSILYVCHLYNALRQTSNLSVLWPDMETFISINTPERLFVGGLPTTLEDCFKRYSLMMGTAPENFARDYQSRNRARALKHSKKGPRDWHVDPPIVKIFKERYLSLDGSVRWTILNIESLLKETDTEAHVVKKRWEKSHQLSPLQLLTALQIALAGEFPELTYDYFGMHIKCLNLLRQLRSENHDKLLQYCGPEYLEREDQISTVAGYIIMISVRTEMAGEALTSQSTGSHMLVEAGRIMGDFIQASVDQGLGITLGI
ncbi:hypothetical protein JMJ35_009464 [Cladonia borealis]|uniref:DUF6604 domain-containing protein n=1 Tax=Cladonia borealis TaxID=184061 RepID=A0AA39V6M3_9LECA|nr:hypothetical protein JMJ35_009464 [Cladonia borealis]